MLKIIRYYSNLKIVKYGLVGGISTIIHIVSAYLYIYFISDSIFTSNIIGFLSAFSFSYLLQSFYVFGRAISYKKAIKFFFVQFLSLLIAISISKYLVFYNSYLKVLLVIVILPLITYTAHKIWTFGDSDMHMKAFNSFLKNNSEYLTIFVFLCLVLVVIFRAPIILLEPRFWAEEGSLYFSHAVHSNYFEGIFFSPKNTAGYFNIAASLPATIAARFVPFEYAPFVTTYFSFSILLLIFSLVLWGNSYFWKTLLQRTLVCFIILFFPSSNATGEIWLNCINLQVYCGLLALIIALESTVQVSNAKKWILRSTVLFSIFSGVYAIFLSPIYFIKFYYERSKESLIHLLLITFGVISQISIFLFLKYSGLISATKLGVFSWSKSSLYVLYFQILQPLFGHALGTKVLNHIGLENAMRMNTGQNEQYLLLAGLVSLFIILVPLVLFLLKRINPINVLLVFSFVLLAILTSLFSMHGIPGGRYAVLPSIVVGLLLLRAVTETAYSKQVRFMIGVILMSSILIGAYEFQFKTNPQYTGNTQPRPDWASEVQNWQNNTDQYLTMWPYPRWRASLPSPHMVQDLKQKFDKIDTVYLKSKGGWNAKSIAVNGVPHKFSVQFDVKINKLNSNTVLQVLLLGELNKSMRWVSVDLSDKRTNQNFTVSIDSRKLNKKGHLNMSSVNEIVFRLKSAQGATTLEIGNIQYKSPYSAF